MTAGDYNSLALTSDGQVRAWGRDYFGQLGTGVVDTTESRTPGAPRDM
jgi:alpha-tubulin suppressor-like RCC1 family protein